MGNSFAHAVNRGIVMTFPIQSNRLSAAVVNHACIDQSEDIMSGDVYGDTGRLGFELGREEEKAAES
jgi:hypothetical protein